MEKFVEKWRIHARNCEREEISTGSDGRIMERMEGEGERGWRGGAGRVCKISLNYILLFCVLLLRL